MSSDMKRWKALEEISKLPCSVELENMIRVRKRVSKSDFETIKKSSEALIQVFKSKKIPAEFWMVRDQNRPGYQSFIGIILGLLQEWYDHDATTRVQTTADKLSDTYQQQCIELADLFMKAGGSFWSVPIADRYDRSPPHFDMKYKHSFHPIVDELFISRRFIFRDYLLKTVMSTDTTDSNRSEFIHLFLGRFTGVMNGISKTTAGILGFKNEEALACCKWALKEEAAWIREASMASDATAEKIHFMLKDAKDIVSLKQQPISNPEKIQKRLRTS